MKGLIWMNQSWHWEEAAMANLSPLIEPDAARQGVTGHGVRWVLVASCALAVVIMLALIAATAT
jgi:hypothetical protein